MTDAYDAEDNARKCYDVAIAALREKHERGPLPAYQELLARKRIAFEARGLAKVPKLPDAMFPHQRDVTDFALRAGCAGLFLDTGLGKTYCALAWGNAIVRHTNKPVLMLAPLAVAPQHEREAEIRGIDAKAIRERPAKLTKRIWITNYERLDRFDPADFAGIILDESSILKSFTGKTTRKLIEVFAQTPYRLCCTATPAPNDHMELGNHAEFLGVMQSREMLSRWFINDTSSASQDWRLKGHAVHHFWDWVASWSRCIAQPSDLGYSDDGFALPELVTRHHMIAADRTRDTGDDEGQIRLFRMPENSATSIHREKRMTADARADAIAGVVNAELGEPWIVWCDTDTEADALTERIPNSIEVRGSMTAEQKEDRLVAFSTGQSPVLVTKPSIAGYGLNWQHCARVAFVGLSFSYESYYQAIRRCWRFGQTRPVHVHVAMADTERNIHEVVARKGADHDAMKAAMVGAMQRAHAKSEARVDYLPSKRTKVPSWMRGAA